MYLPTPGDFEDCRHNDEEGRSLVSRVQDFDIKRCAASPFVDPPLRLAPVYSNHVSLWRKIGNIAEAWDFAYSQLTHDHTLSHASFPGALSDDRDTLKSRVCVHGIVHGTATCVVGKPMVAYTNVSPCQCRHEACQTMESDVHFVQVKKTSTVVHVEPHTRCLCYPVQRYLPGYVCTNDSDATASTRLVKFKNKDMSKKTVMVDAFHECHARIVGLNSSIPYTRNALSVTVSVPPHFFGTFLPDVGMLAVINNVEEDPSNLHFAKFKFDKYGQYPTMKNVAEYLATFPRAHFHALPQPVMRFLTGMKEQQKSVDWFCNNNFATLWPTATNIYHGIQSLTCVDVFCKYPDFGQSTWMPLVYETGIVWRDDPYAFMLERNTWCLDHGIGPPLNVHVMVKNVTYYTEPEPACAACHTREFGTLATAEADVVVLDGLKSMYEEICKFIFRPIALAVFVAKSPGWRNVTDPVLLDLAATNLNSISTNVKSGYSILKICRDTGQELLVQPCPVHDARLPDKEELVTRWFDRNDSIYVNVGPETDVEALLSLLDFITDDAKVSNKRKAPEL